MSALRKVMVAAALVAGLVGLGGGGAQAYWERGYGPPRGYYGPPRGYYAPPPPPPVYYAPRPIYVPRPVYVPPPVFYGPPRGYYGGGGGWGHGRGHYDRRW